MKLIDPTQPFTVVQDCPTLHFVINCLQLVGKYSIRNVETKMQLLDTGTHLFPVSVNSGAEREDNSYVVSPRTAYTEYAKDELKRMQRPWLTWPLKLLIYAISRKLKKAQIDRLVQVNNWLLSTNLYPLDWDKNNLAEITSLLVEEYPTHAIAFRSLNRFSNSALVDRLITLGYISIPSRQVYLFDMRDGSRSPSLNRHNTKVDNALLRRMPYRIDSGKEFCDADYLRMEQLYNQLYLDKYCRLNPQYSADWLRCGQRDGWLELHVLRTKEGRIDGVVGWFLNLEVMTAPIVGYDISLSQKQGLYRILTQMCLQEAARRQCVLNFSSGASRFKRLRGGEPEIEYSMVYVKHLPIARKLVWKLLSIVLHSIGVPVMKAFKL